MKAFITKYALTQGILELDVINHGDDMISNSEQGGAWTTYYHGEGDEWHKTKDAAIRKAEQMRIKKIASLKKQIQRLEKLSFK